MPDPKFNEITMQIGILPPGSEYEAAKAVAWHFRDEEPKARKTVVSNVLECLGLTPTVLAASRAAQMLSETD